MHLSMQVKWISSDRVSHHNSICPFSLKYILDMYKQQHFHSVHNTSKHTDLSCIHTFHAANGGGTLRISAITILYTGYLATTKQACAVQSQPSCYTLIFSGSVESAQFIHKKKFLVLLIQV